MRRGSDALETINAAANVIASGDIRSSRPTKRRWGSRWSLYWCFGTNRRIGHASLIPEPTTTIAVPNLSEPDRRPPPPSTSTLFAAPPSSPASFIPSTAQSPTHVLSLSMSANMSPPSGPASVFAAGPYAHEIQLVSPPVFSTFTTEPSTPPPESTHGAPPSPEVPFARLVEPPEPGGLVGPISHCEFQSSYQLQPGSPVSHLISPISNSGTSSPFLDRGELVITPFFLGEILRRGLGQDQPGCPMDRHDSDVGPLRDENMAVEDGSLCDGETEAKSRTITLGSTKEFNFDTVEEEDGKRGSDWTFFPAVQTGVS